MKVLKLGSKGKDVKALQTALAAATGEAVKVDGDFGPKTEAALKAFQLLAGVKVDGEYGPETAKALLAATAPKPAAPPSPTPTEIVEVDDLASIIAQEEITHTKRVYNFDADGWYEGATCQLKNSKRVGGKIEPRMFVFHTTDCMPGSLSGILKRLCTETGNGAGAHFWIGRHAPTDADVASPYPNGGVVQTASIYRNGNHAGGKNGHGQIVVDGKLVHPNTCAIGVEVDCGGRLSKRRHTQTGETIYFHPDSGRVVPLEDVYLDERGTPWHTITEYQYEQLGILADSLDLVMAPLWPGASIKSNGNYQRNGVTWAALTNPRFVGHVTLDPQNKTDPGPRGIEWLRMRYNT